MMSDLVLEVQSVSVEEQLGACSDGIAKEKDTWRSLLLQYMNALPEEGVQENLFVGGLDPKHQSKCGRGSMAFGRSSSSLCASNT